MVRAFNKQLNGRSTQFGGSLSEQSALLLLDALVLELTAELSRAGGIIKR